MIVAFAVKSSTERNNFPYRSSRPETCISGLSTYIPPSLSHAIQLKEGTIPHYINGREVHRGYSDAPDKGNPQKILCTDQDVSVWFLITANPH